MEKIRGIVRPLLTLSGWAVLMYIVIKSVGILEAKTYEIVAVSIIEACLSMALFWFGMRTGNKEK